MPMPSTTGEIPWNKNLVMWQPEDVLESRCGTPHALFVCSLNHELRRCSALVMAAAGYSPLRGMLQGHLNVLIDYRGPKNIADPSVECQKVMSSKFRSAIVSA